MDELRHFYHPGVLAEERGEDGAVADNGDGLGLLLAEGGVQEMDQELVFLAAEDDLLRGRG